MQMKLIFVTAFLFVGASTSFARGNNCSAKSPNKCAAADGGYYCCAKASDCPSTPPRKAPSGCEGAKNKMDADATIEVDGAIGVGGTGAPAGLVPVEGKCPRGSTLVGAVCKVN